uniref:Uncharacterized protein n=1 Tax=Musa acuminata subsp. malaccensis TaxID=214687 RepID=A0A804IBD4_MUSAM
MVFDESVSDGFSRFLPRMIRTRHKGKGLRGPPNPNANKGKRVIIGSHGGITAFREICRARKPFASATAAVVIKKIEKQRGGCVHSVVRMILCFLGGMVRKLAQMQVPFLKHLKLCNHALLSFILHPFPIKILTFQS